MQVRYTAMALRGWPRHAPTAFRVITNSSAAVAAAAAAAAAARIAEERDAAGGLVERNCEREPGGAPGDHYHIIASHDAKIADTTVTSASRAARKKTVQLPAHALPRYTVRTTTPPPPTAIPRETKLQDKTITTATHASPS